MIIKNTLITTVLLLIFNPLHSQVQIGNDLDGEAPGDNFGFSTTLSADGSIVAGGANFNEGTGPGAGHVRVFENMNGTWVQIGNDIDAQSLGDQTGQSIQLSADGSIIVVGEPINDDVAVVSGQVRVFENINGAWTQIGSDINGDDFNYQMGHKVDISDDGSIIAGGAFGANVAGLGAFTGHVRVFENQNGAWVQIGSDLEGEEALDLYGKSVSLSADGSIIAIGAPGNPSSQEIGYVQILENINGTWTQIGANIVGTANGFGDEISISSDGSIVAIGSIGGTPEGKVVVFENSNGTWTQIGSDLIGEAVDDNFGSAVSLSNDGNILFVGAAQHNANGNNSGRAYIYHNQGGSWVQIGNPIDGQAGDLVGISACISTDATTVSVGGTAANGTGVVRVYDLTEFVSITEIEDQVECKLFPNPAADYCRIELNSDVQLMELSVFELTGKLILTSSEANLDLHEIPAGDYLIEIQTDQGTATKKLSIQ
jgi:Flp pilus assembly pilin Flp